MEQVRDQKCHRWPKCWKTAAGDYLLKARILPAVRVALVDTYLITPLQKIWKVAIGVLIFDFVFVWLNLFYLLRLLQISREELISFIVVLPLLYIFEMATRRALLTLFLGQTICIRFTTDLLKVHVGWRRYVYSREAYVGFACSPLPAANLQAYQDSRSVELVVENLRTIRLFECYDPRKASFLVANCNLLNTLGARGGGFEIDPRDQFRPS